LPRARPGCPSEPAPSYHDEEDDEEEEYEDDSSPVVVVLEVCEICCLL